MVHSLLENIRYAKLYFFSEIKLISLTSYQSCRCVQEFQEFSTYCLIQQWFHSYSHQLNHLYHLTVGLTIKCIKSSIK